MSCLACCLRLLCKKSTSSTVDGVSCLLRSWITYPAAEKWGERRRKWHDRRAHSCETVASVLDEHVETVGIDENHNKMWHWIWNRTLLFLHLLSKYVLVLLKKMRKSHWHLIMVCAPNISGCAPKIFIKGPQCSQWKKCVWGPAGYIHNFILFKCIFQTLHPGIWIIVYVRVKLPVLQLLGGRNSVSLCWGIYCIQTGGRISSPNNSPCIFAWNCGISIILEVVKK